MMISSQKNKVIFIYLFLFLCQVFSQDTNKKEVINDSAFVESIRTEIHPDRYQNGYPADIRVRYDFVYGVDKGRDLKADIFTPKIIPEKSRPAIVFLHGGSWMFGRPSQFHMYAAYLAEKYDFFSMSVNYRTSIEARFPAALQDAKCAVRWLRSRSKDLNINPNRIAICGGSAGAHLASMVATTAGIKEYEGEGGYQEFSSQVNLGIFINGEFDLWDLVEKGSLIQAMRVFIGGTPDEMPERYDELSTINRIHKDVPPILFLHGTEDKCVSHQQSVAFYDTLLKLGIPAEIELYEGKPHAWFNKEPDKTIVLMRIEKFLIDQFKLE